MKKKVFYGILERIYGFFKKILRILLITGAFFAGMQLGSLFCKKRTPVLPDTRKRAYKNSNRDTFDSIKAQIDELDRELEKRLKEQPPEEFLEESEDFSEDTSDVINNWDNMFDIPKESIDSLKNDQSQKLLCDIPRLIKQDAKLNEGVRKKYEVQVAGCILCYLKGIPFDGTMDRKELVERLNCTYTLFDRTERTVRNYINGYCASLSPLTCGEAKKLLGLSVDFALDGKVQNAIIEKEDNPKLYEEMEFWMKRMKERYLLYNNIYKENKQ